MSRKPRIWYPGATYHIYKRGNRRSDLFHDNSDRYKYFNLLADTKQRYPFTLHSYCLMTNHIHLLLQTDQHNIGLIMQDLNFRYAIYFNKKYSLEGHVFQNRYGSSLITSDAKFLNIGKYIHLNPSEAKMVKKPENFKWSSYHYYVTNTPNQLITKEKTLSYFPAPQIENFRRFTMEP
ncbi:transposase [Bacillus weihaiensis]|uniref:transposase n=1 Tax=Bacillus weihaiensis TaxID=1547283 RepID=UPI000934A2B8|nr:transposase [Bacillus weihaiensis]